MKAVVVFPGSGSQYIGMGRRLCEKHVLARKIFDTANSVLGYDLKKICMEGSLTKLSKNEHLQPAILTISVIMYMQYIEKQDVEVVLSAGHSLGEYAAMVCSNVLSLEEALRIIRIRGLAMDQVDGNMTIVNDASRDYVEALCSTIQRQGEKLSIACINSQRQYMLSGSKESVAKAEDIMAEDKVKFTMMYHSVPAHCELMSKVVGMIQGEFEQCKKNDSSYAVISNCTGERSLDKNILIQNLEKQLIMPVLWNKTVDVINDADADYCLEVGPKTILRDLLLENHCNKKVLAMDDVKDRLQFYKEIAQEKVKGSKSCNDMIRKCIKIIVSTKNYNRDITEEQYKEGVIKNYNWIKELRNDMETNNREISEEEKSKVLTNVGIILETKNVPHDKRNKKINEIMRSIK